LGEHVVDITLAAHDAVLEEGIQAYGQHVRRDAEVVLEVAEPCDPSEEGVANDQQAPPLADEFERACDRAHLRVVCLPQHGFHPSTCMMQVAGLTSHQTREYR